MREELRKTLDNEDQRAELLHKKLRELENIIAEKDNALLNQEKATQKTMHKAKKLKKENKEIMKTLTMLKENYENNNKLLDQLQMENGQYKDNQLDFQSILNEKLDQVTKELKSEREKRLAEQTFNRELEEKLMMLESQYKNEISYLKIELARKDKKMLSNAELVTKKEETYKTQQPNNNTSLLLENEKDYANNKEYVNTNLNMTAQSRKEKPEKDLKEIRSEIERFEKKVVRDSERLNSLRTNEDQGDSRQFIDKFKRVIDKLENRLEKMSSDIKVNHNNSYELFDK